MIIKKLKNKIYFYLDDALFKNDDIKFIKLSKIFEILITKEFLIKGSINLEMEESNLELVLKCFGKQTKVIRSKKIIASSKTDFDLQTEFQGNIINLVLKNVIEKDALFNAQCYDKTNDLLLEFTINDNDGSIIKLNPNVYNFKNIKTAIENIIEL